MPGPAVLLVGGPDVDARIPLMRFLRNDFEIAAVGSNPALADHFSAAGFTYYTYGLGRSTNPLRDALAIWQLTGIFRRLKPRIVHAFDTKPGVYACIAARLAGVPVVVGTVTGLGSLYVTDSWSVRMLRRVYEQLQKLASAFSDLTIFQNRDDASQFVDGGVVPAGKALLIPGSGVMTDVYSQSAITKEDRLRLRAQLGLPPDEPVVTMISRVIRSKGVLDFVAAARDASERGLRARFVLVGADDPESVDRLTNAERDLLRKTVIWTGPRRDIAAILGISSAFVLPTAYREGIPRVLLEAASMGLPIVTTDSPGCNDVVEDGVNGFLIRAGDPAALGKAILQLLEQPELREHFGQISRRRAVEQFDLSVIASQTRLAYARLLAGRARPVGVVA